MEDIGIMTVGRSSICILVNCLDFYQEISNFSCWRIFMIGFI